MQLDNDYTHQTVKEKKTPTIIFVKEVDHK